MHIDDAMAEMPLVAIIRGVRPEEVVAIGDALYRAGIRIVEVPLNSPSPLVSIGALSRAFGSRMVYGAGTVLGGEQVQQVADAGGRIAVAPNTDADVIKAALAAGLIPLPGFLSPTEAFVAISAGASILKLFPASSVGPSHVSAIRAVLPPEVRILPVGGVGPDNLAAWRTAGAAGFGLGSGLYRPGDTPEAAFEKAASAVAAMRACF